MAVHTTGDSRQLPWALGVLGVFVFASTARADAPRKPLTLAQFVRAFQRSNPTLQVASARVRAASAAVVRAGLRPNPTVSYQREHVFGGGGEQADDFFTLGWSFDISGGRSRRLAAARHGVASARATRDQRQLQVLIRGLHTYLDAAHARKRVELLRKGREPLRRFIRVLQKRAAGGDVAGYAVSRLKLELGEYDNQVATAERQLAAANRKLGALLGDATSRYSARDELRLPSAGRAAGSGWLASRPDYRAAEARLRQANAQLRAADRAWIPRLGVVAGLKTADTGSGRSTGYVASLSLTIPLFRRGQALRARAGASRRIALAQLRALRSQAPLREQTASATLRDLVRQARTYQTNQLRTAATVVTRAEKRYQGGVGSIVELVDAYQMAQRVRLRALRLRLQARKAELALMKLRGRVPGGR